MEEDTEKQNLDNALNAVKKVAEKYEGIKPEELIEPEAQEEEEELSVTEELRGLIVPKSSTEISVAVINDAYDRLYHAAFNLWDANSQVVDAQANVESLQAQIKLLETQAVLDGRNTGKNEDQRRAFNLETFKKEYENLEKLKQELVQVKADAAVEQLGYDIGKWNVQRVEMILKFFDIQTTINMAKVMEEQAAQPQVPTGSVLKVKH